MIVSFGCVYLWPACAYAEYKIAPAQWEQLKRDKAFTYKNDIEKAPQQTAENNSAIIKFLRAIAHFFSDGGGYYLLWILAAGLLIWMLYSLLISKDIFLFSRKAKTFTPAGQPAEEEDINSDWASLALRASANNDLRLAVRYNYMLLLQLLQKGELIQYRSDKTNFEYAAELADTAYKQPFKQLSRQYEYTWYGNYVPTTAAYDDYAAMLHELKTKLGA